MGFSDKKRVVSGGFGSISGLFLFEKHGKLPKIELGGLRNGAWAPESGFLNARVQLYMYLLTYLLACLLARQATHAERAREVPQPN